MVILKSSKNKEAASRLHQQRAGAREPRLGRGEHPLQRPQPGRPSTWCPADSSTATTPSATRRRGHAQGRAADRPRGRGVAVHQDHHRGHGVLMASSPPRPGSTAAVHGARLEPIAPARPRAGLPRPIFVRGARAAGRVYMFATPWRFGDVEWAVHDRQLRRVARADLPRGVPSTPPRDRAGGHGDRAPRSATRRRTRSPSCRPGGAPSR